jgi:polyferredoxin
VPLLLLDEQLRAATGILFHWKMFVLVCVLIACVFVYRPFCRVCPLGAIYGLFHKVAVLGMAVDRSKCGGCSGCKTTCPMDTECTSSACIRCGRCVKNCPTDAVKYTVMGKER